MSLVERLRAYSEEGWPIVHEAADEIERLRAALQEVVRLIGGDEWSKYNADIAAANVARAALERKDV